MRISFYCFLLLGIFLLQKSAIAQNDIPRPSQTSDTVRWVQILNANKFLFRSIDSVTELQILTGKVQMRQGNTLFTADSVTYNEKNLQLEAFGNVHIKDADSINIYAQYLNYDGQKKLAYFKNKVRLSDGNSTLFTETMDYDLNSKVGTYTGGGRIDSKQTTLTSTKGFYYADIKDIYFIGDVKMSDPEMTLATDSLLYNTGSRVSTFIAPTTIKNGNSVIQTKEGFYDLKQQKAKFGGRTRIQDSSSVLTANDFAFDDATGQGEAKGNVGFVDTSQNIALYSNRIYFNKKKKSFLATEKPVMIVAREKDSTYIAADTIYSGIMSDTQFMRKTYWSKVDSTINKTGGKTDSLRFITAFRNVRIFNDSLQAIGDSLYYSEVDSLFELYYNPVAWSRKTQLSGDTIFIETQNQQPKKLRVFENALVIEQNSDEIDFFNQIKSRIINGYFKEGKMEYIEAKGSAESIYYIKNEDQAYVGMNRNEADEIDIHFDSATIQKIKLINAVKGTTYPIRQIPEEEKKLRKFNWMESKRPKNKWELFF